MSKNNKHEAKKEHINKYKMAHMIAVAEYMRNNAKKYLLDPDEMYVVGLLHDIGYLEGRRDHEETGADILEGLEISPLVAEAIRFHGTSPKKLSEDVLQNRILLLLYEADQQIDTEGHYVGFDGRLKDFEKRYGKDSVAYQTASETIEFVISKLLDIKGPDDVEYFDIHPFHDLDHYFFWSYSEKDGYIVIDGIEYEFEMSFSNKVPDEYCHRVYIDGRYYYF